MPYKALRVKDRKGGYSKRHKKLTEAARMANPFPVSKSPMRKAKKAVRRYEGTRKVAVDKLKGRAKRLALAGAGATIVYQASKH